MPNTPSVRKKEKIVDIKRLKKYFPIKAGVFKRTVRYVKAVDDVSFAVYKGETLGVVGESGSGKSTLVRLIARLLEPTDGEIFLQGHDITQLSQRKLRTFRKEMQVVFQDPHGSLNPRMSVGELIEEPMLLRSELSKKDRQQQVSELLDAVGLPSQAHLQYPHQFSGGQRQRIGIARALAVRPAFIIADEPVSSLDVSVQAQILNVLKDLQKEFELTYLFISHDIRVVKHMSDRVAVMYRGKLIEIAPTDTLYENPLHPYTQLLFSSAKGAGLEATSITNGKGCSFYNRCPIAQDRCKQESPELIDTGNDQYVSCHQI